MRALHLLRLRGGAHFSPQWGIWQQFLNGTTATALNRDALLENFPIEIPGGEHLVINTSTAPIIYNKGGSILRQVEGTSDRRISSGDCSATSRPTPTGPPRARICGKLRRRLRPAGSAMMQSWVEQPGFPLVTAARQGDTLVLSNAGLPISQRLRPENGLIPSICAFSPPEASRAAPRADGRSRGPHRYRPGRGAFKLNDAQTGFYRVKYADPKPPSARRPVAAKDPAPEDRWGLQNDLYAWPCRRCGLDDYLAFLDLYSEEDAYLPLASIAGNLAHAYLTAGPETKARSPPWPALVWSGSRTHRL